MKKILTLAVVFIVLIPLYSAILPRAYATLSLTNGYVTPGSGTTTTTFYYYVTYYDSSGYSPELGCVVIDGSSVQIMSLYSGAPSNGVYRYGTTLSVGTHNYYFRFNAGGGGSTVYLPLPSSPYSGPTVTPPQHLLSVSSAHDSPNPSNGNRYFNDGQFITCSVTSPVTEGSTKWTCTGWTGTGNVPSSGSGTSTSFTITQDSSITWNWHGTAVADFTISNPGTITASEAGQGTSSITVASTNGYSNVVSLSAIGQPTGVSVSFAPSTSVPTFSSTITVTVGYNVPLNTYSITVTGTGSDGTSHSIAFSLTVIAGSGATMASKLVPKEPLKSITLGSTSASIDMSSKTVMDSASYVLSGGTLNIYDPFTIPLLITLPIVGSFTIGRIDISFGGQLWKASNGGDSVWILDTGTFIQPDTSSSGDLLCLETINIVYQIDSLPQGSDTASFVLDITKTASNLPIGQLQDLILNMMKDWNDLAQTVVLLSSEAPIIISDLLPIISVSLSGIVMAGVRMIAFSAFLVSMASIVFLAIMASPANILVTGPDGRMVGVNASGGIMNQLPGAIYSTNQTSDAKLIWIMNATSGQYKVTVNGTGSGVYHLDLHFVNGTYTSSNEFVGLTSPSEVKQFVENVTVAANPSSSAIDREYLNVTQNGSVFRVIIESNSTINNLNYDESLKQIGFNATGTLGTQSHCKVVVPKALMNGIYTVSADDILVPYTKTENTTHTSIQFTYLQSSFQMRLLLTIRVHDVAVTNVMPSKTVIGQGFRANLTTTVANFGNYTETFKVTIYADATPIASQNVSLTSGTSAIITFIWNTTGFAYGNHTIRAYAEPVMGETSTANNSYTYGIVLVTIPGDVNGDGKVNVLDLILIATHLGHHATDYTPFSLEWYKFNNCDLNGDGNINVLDLITCATRLGQHWP